MKGKVKVCAYNGAIVIPNKNNPEYGSIRVEQEVSSFAGGFMESKKRSAFINGKTEELKSFVAANGITEGSLLDGNITIKETLDPIIADRPDFGQKEAGDTGVVCKVGGQPIYRQSLFTQAEESDTLLAHDNSDEITLAQERLEEAAEAEAGDESAMDA